MTEQPKKFRHLPDRLGDIVEWPVEETRVHNLWKGTRRRMSTPHFRARRPETIVAIAAMLTSAVLALRLAYRAEPNTHPVSSARRAIAPMAADVAVDAAAPAKTWVLATDSRVTLAPGSRLLTLQNDDVRFDVELRRGRARFSVAAHPSHRCRVVAGRAMIEAVSSEFEVEHRDGEVTVQVIRGQAEVRSPRLEGGRRRLTSGRSLRIHKRAPVFADRTAPHRPLHAGSRPAKRASSQSRRNRKTGSSTTPDNARVNRESARPPGTVVENLMLKADLARLSEHPEAAVAPLTQVLEEYADDPRAPLAAVTLGRLLMDQLRRPDEALRVLELALRWGVPSAIRADVEARVSRLRGRMP